jgi:lipoprotein signal peptidase
MALSTDPWVWIAAFFTLCIYSFLYKDNPFFKFAEHVMVGVAGGYILCLAWYHTLKPEVVLPLIQERGLSLRIIAGVLAILMLFRISSKHAWLSRWAISFMIGVLMGNLIPGFFKARVVEQIRGCLEINFQGSWVTIVGQFILLIGTLGGLCYFFFSKEHKGVYGKFARLGVLIIMIGFGASFGYTVMARISLFIGRVLFLMRDWLGLIT